MESKNSVLSWNFSAMSKQVSPLSTPTTVSHCGVAFLAAVPIAHSRINGKRCQSCIQHAQYFPVFFNTTELRGIIECVALQKVV